MERKNIAFQYGIHRSPSSSNDGELAECINMEVHNGELTPSAMPEIAFTLEGGDRLLFVHKFGSYKNYIIQRGSLLMWFSDEDKTRIIEIGEITPTSIHSIGNTLVVLSENQMEYILYKSEDYKRIGSKPPFCSISFGLRTASIETKDVQELITWDLLSQCTTDKATTFPDTYYSYRQGEIDSFDFNFKEDYLISESAPDPEETPKLNDAITVVNKLTESFHAADNELRSICKKYGHVCDSFFIRYAYRMYDGSHYMHSSPIFMPLNAGGSTSCAWSVTGRDRGTALRGLCDVNAKQIDYKVIGFYKDSVKVESNAILDWSDLIEGIDIFVSPGIPRYKSDAKVYGFTSDSTTLDGLCYIGSKGERIGSGSGSNFVHDTYKMHLYTPISQLLDLELKEFEYFIDEIKEQSLFYKIASFKINSLESLVKKNDREILSIKEGILTTLEQQERLEDDYDSHDYIIPSFAYVYNGRINISGIKTRLFSGYPLESMVPYTYDAEKENYTFKIMSKIEIDGNSYITIAESNIPLLENPAFIYYPKPRCSMFFITKTSEDGTPYSLEAVSEIHKILNGAFYLSPSFGTNDEYPVFSLEGGTPPQYVDYPNKIYTSEVNNPFFFPLSGRNSIGIGEIIAITSNTKAISPGQFGQYPLIVFSTDGVWAMQTGEDGLYYSVHPISKDICINPNVLQTDGPILFATANGLHSIVSDDVQNISLTIKGRPENITYPLLNNTFNLMVESVTNDSMTFNEFIKEAMFSYDYTNSRVVIYRSDKNYMYVYSMKSGMYSKMVIVNGTGAVNLQTAINAYPEVFMQAGSDIYTFTPDTDNTDGIYKGIIATRPLVFSDPLARKVVNDVRIIHHKVRKDTRCKYVMLVSDDGYNWIQRGSLRGHTFKYIRFVIFAELSDIESLVGMSIMYDYRRTNKLR